MRTDRTLTPRRVILAVTGASGVRYARLTLDRLLASAEVERVAVIVSDNGRAVMRWEGEELPADDRRAVFYANDDLFAPPASGSAGYEAMVVVPCSVGCAGRIAAGVSEGLIGRAADVMLKERRPLVLVVREMPLSTLHLRNLTQLSADGAVVLPACPSFYDRPADMDALCATVVDRTMAHLGFPFPGRPWGEGR